MQADSTGSSCAAVRTVDGCTTTVEQVCAYADGCENEFLLVLDEETQTGILSVFSSCPDTLDFSCIYESWVESR